MVLNTPRTQVLILNPQSLHLTDNSKLNDDLSCNVGVVHFVGIKNSMDLVSETEYRQVIRQFTIRASENFNLNIKFASVHFIFLL